MSAPASIAHYRIVAKLGEGGMGAVYRATDTKLNRDVAIKILPDAFAADPDRLARFTREAQVLASLNHPNIAALHGVEERALVMELVDGPTLEERIAQGPIPLDEALPIARQMAEALEYAHDRGIVHRDLKPANIKVTPEGRVKVLDFGLAKALATERGLADPSSSPTLTMRATQAGAIMGTAGYMSPEQAKGKPVDRRADLWAFGVVLAEMLTGRSLYAAETVSETLALVLLQPPDLTGLPAALPPAVRRLIERCLDRDPTMRLQHAGEARIVLNNPGEAAPAPPPAAASRPRGRFLAVGLAIAGVAIGFAAAMALVRSRPAPPPAVRFQLPLFEKAASPIFEVSPDGRHLAFTAAIDGPPRLWVRALDSLEVKAIAGTEGASYPAWSPDSAWIAFFAQGKLKRIALTGGPAQVLCDAADGRGAAWGQAGSILFAPSGTAPLYRVAAGGGTPVQVTRTAAIAAREYDRYPSFIAGTDRFLYLHMTADPNHSGVYLASMSEAAPVRILPDQSNASYVPDARGEGGWIVFRREQSVLAQPFDARSARLTGDPVVLGGPVGMGGNTGRAAFSASTTGTLVIWAGDRGGRRQLVWFDNSGRRLATVTDPVDLFGYALAPDEKRVAMNLRTEGRSDIWVQDIERGSRSRFSFVEHADGDPLWSPDGHFIAFANRPNALMSRLYRKPADGSAKEELLTEQSHQMLPAHWSRDGKHIVYGLFTGNSSRDLWLLPMGGAHGEARTAEPYLKAKTNTVRGALSPDSRWMAYASDESAEYRIYVQAVPAGGAKWQISTAGGNEPSWRRDGKEIYFIASDRKLMAVPVDAGGGNFRAGTPRPLFELPAQTGYRASADGQRFLVSVPAEGEASVPPVEVLVNWHATLRKAEAAP